MLDEGVQQESLSPNVLEEVELIKLLVIEDVEVEDVLLILLE